MPISDYAFGGTEVAALLRERLPFTYAKINHGFWERLVRVDRLRAQGITDPIELDRQSGGAPCLFETGFLAELDEELASIPGLSGRFLFGASPYAWPGCDRIEGTPNEGLPETLAMIRRHVPQKIENADPLLWANAIADGSFANLIDPLRGRRIVLIGPDWGSGFGAFAGIQDFAQIEIDGADARRNRNQTVETVRAGHSGNRQPVYLISAGAMSAWLAVKMHRALDDATILDLGTALYFASLGKLIADHRSLTFRAETAAAMEAINPAWPHDPRASAHPSTRRTVVYAGWDAFKAGVETKVTQAADLPLRIAIAGAFDRPRLDSERVDFIEAKQPDWGRVEEIAGLSARANRWANFGPVSRALERGIAAALDIGADREVVAASSATSALFALAGAHAARAGKNLRWIVSAFGFNSTVVGPFADSCRVVDCDGGGLLDLGLVAEIPPGEWDGMLVTIPFGLDVDVERYAAFCRERGKVLILDAAGALFRDRTIAPDVDEVVSFHHTKPWGFGEGGCAIVPADLAPTVRRLLDFGIGQGAAAAGYSANGKLSDIAAAPILDRLERMPRWRFFYERQYRRLIGLMRAAGLRRLGTRSGATVTAMLPILAKGPVEIAELPAARFVVRKYYRPLAADAPVANDLYRRIVCVPAHPGMASVPTEELQDFLAAVKRAGR